MSSTFPVIPGYNGPYSLKEFVHRLFSLQLRFETSLLPTMAQPTSEKILFLQPTGDFVVVVYLSLSAPPPPPPLLALALAAEKGAGTAKALTIANDTRLRSLSTSLHGRPLTLSVLGHPLFDSLFAQLGTTAVGFMARWCPVVVQFQPMAGGLQVFGPPLKNAVPRGVKHYRSTETVGTRKVARREGGTQEHPPCKSSGLLASLYQLNVSRLALIGEAPPRAFAETNCTVSLILEGFWREHYHHSGRDGVNWTTRCTLVNGREEMRCADDCNTLTAAKQLVYLVFPYTLSVECAGDTNMNSVKEHLTHLLHCVLGNVCRMNIRGAAIKHVGFLEERSRTISYNNNNKKKKKRSRDHSNNNTRGTGNGEVHNNDSSSHSRRRTESVKHTTIAVSELTTPEPIIVSYLQTLFADMRWRAPLTTERMSFWGDPLVLTELCSTTLGWLKCGRQEIFSLSHFLHKIPVARIPWLRGFYTKAFTPKRRSMIQQRIFLQLVFFLFQHVVPFLLRRSFHVTWSSKNSNAFVFIPKPVWSRLVSRELGQVCIPHRRQRGGGGGSAEERNHSNDTLPPMALKRVTTEEMVGLKANIQHTGNDHHHPTSPALPPSTTTASVSARSSDTGSSDASLVYSSIRFLLDRHKIRPIARVRFGKPHTLSKMITRVRSPLYDSTTTRRRTTTTTSTTTVSKSPNSSILRESLRCLLAGMGESQEGSTLAKFTNVSHQNEYADIRSFVEGARQFCTSPLLVPHSVSWKAPMERVVVTMVRGDAVRCYDCLPQEAVMNVVERLVIHELYHTLRLTAITPSLAGSDYIHRRTVSHENTGNSLLGLGEGTRHYEIPRRQFTRLQTVPGNNVEKGVISGIPKGWIVYEEVTTASDSVIRGDEVRAVLKQHLQSHPVMIDGKLYTQNMGVTQGSPVAMLLCNTLLERVDLSLSGILSEHEEPSLLLRRVDDVLVVTLSPIASLRCDAALRTGWSEVGFACQWDKLQCTRSALVPWCGLLWNPQTLEFGVEWARLASLLPCIAVRPRSGNELLYCSLRLLGILCLRAPLTVFCRRLNSKARVVQTLYEMSLLWSRFVLQKLVENANFMRPHMRTVLKPLALAITALRRLLRRQTGAVERAGSFCDITDEDVRLCLLVALHRTLEEVLPWMVSRMRRSKGITKSFLLLLRGVVERKMETALLMTGTATHKKNVIDASTTITTTTTTTGHEEEEEICGKDDSDIADTVGMLLFAEGTDTVTMRALAAVRFAPSRAPA